MSMNNNWNKLVTLGSGAFLQYWKFKNVDRTVPLVRNYKNPEMQFGSTQPSWPTTIIPWKDSTKQRPKWPLFPAEWYYNNTRQSTCSWSAKDRNNDRKPMSFEKATNQRWHMEDKKTRWCWVGRKHYCHSKTTSLATADNASAVPAVKSDNQMTFELISARQLSAHDMNPTINKARIMYKTAQCEKSVLTRGILLLCCGTCSWVHWRWVQ